MRLGRRIRPPPPAIRPRDASGMPNFAWSAATTMSQLIRISNPPASATPLAAAMSGFAKSRWVMPPNPLSVMGSSPAAKALRSIPAEKALSPAPVKTTTQTSSSLSHASSASPRAMAVARLMALRASGRLMVRISTCPRRSRSTSSAMVLLRTAPRGNDSNDTGVRFDLACETDPVERRPRRYVTLEGYAVEGGLDGPYQPSTCFRPTIALGRHVGPGDADDLWHDYEQVLDLVPAMGFDGVRLSVEWARVEPHRGQVDETALERYDEVARYAYSLGLGVTVVIVDGEWPAWLGLEAWLLPWVAPLVVEHASRVVQSIDAASGVVVFADPASLVNGFLVSSAPPWRRGAGVDADMSRAQIASITAAIRDDPLVGPKIVAST